ncbi:MAG: class I SAM-dependent methyltransferase [Pseudomonadota bacterium]|nr:class I SAM-dependent methyltransferase [Pseudomonadota bacterium]
MKKSKNINPDITRWNRKYRELESEPDWTPEPELVEFSDQIRGSGLALDLACGAGKNALYLARLGYDVIAMDAALEGLRRCAQAAHWERLTVHPACVDLERYPLPESRFDLIIVVRYLNRALFPAIQTALKPGGLLFYKTFNRNFLQQKPGFNPDYVLRPGELVKSFSDLEIFESSDGEHASTSFIIARNSRLVISSWNTITL